MNTTLPILSPAALAVVTLGHALDDFHARDAEADAALEAVADYASHARLWEKACVEKLAALNMIAFEAETLRRHARRKLLWEWHQAIRPFLGKEERE